MKKYFNRIITIMICLLMVQITMLNAQEAEEKVDTRPVRSPFETTTLIDMPTIKNLNKGSFDLMIHHRFGKMGNGFDDLFGIYAPSNIRMGLVYGVTDNISVGFGTEKNNKMQQLLWKWNILNQTRSGNIPVNLTYYGNVVIDAANEEKFGVNYEFPHRLSFFNELMVSRKFSRKISLLAGVSFTHFNSVDSLAEHDKIAIHAGGRIMLWGTNSLILEYSQPLQLLNIAEHVELINPPKAGLGIGLEFGTSTHAFQVFVSNYEHIIEQRNIAFNQNDFFDGDILLGFNITVRLN
jgi:hypothetical protein